mgnify:FL=1
MDLSRNYEELANGIVMQAGKDYRAALKKPEGGAAISMQREVERFFRSAWFSELTDVEPKVILAGLRREAGL